jgi:hypothetical protein
MQSTNKTFRKIRDVLDLLADTEQLESELAEMSQSERDYIYNHPLFSEKGGDEVQDFLFP